jgi:hypothetical protein
MIARVLVIGSFAVAAIMIYAIVDVAISPAARVRSIPKPAWFVVIVLFPLIGAILWFFLGRPRKNSGAPDAPPKDVVDRPTTTGPFSTESVDDRIARLEEELKRLDDEGDVPPKDKE